MRILFIGTVRFSLRCLETIIACGGDVVAVITTKPKNNHFNADFADLRPLCERNGIDCYEVGAGQNGRVEKIARRLKPDVIFVLGWSRLLPPAVLEIPKLGCIGSHPSLLPQGRGRHPLVWALVEDLPRSGLSFFLLSERPDEGHILWQGAFEISDEDDAAALYAKMEFLAAGALPTLLRQLESGTIAPVPQDESLATHWRKRGESDGKIDWQGSSRSVFNLVRALTHPYVGAHTYADSRKATVWRCRVEGFKSDAPSSACGTIVRADSNGWVVRAADGCVRLIEVDWPAGYVPEVGVRLGGDT